MILLSKVSPGNRYARSTDDRISAGLFSAWTKMRQREVACSTSEVSDQNQLIVVQLGFILICGRDRFEFECNFGKAGQIGRRSEPVECQSLVPFVFSSGKADRPADHDAGQRKHRIVQLTVVLKRLRMIAIKSSSV